MKQNLLFSASLTLAFILLQSFGDPYGKKPSGSPGGYSGSPHDAKNCTQCHGGTAQTVSGWITSNVPITGYVPGTSYTITVTATGSGKKGFEISPQNTAGMCMGTLTSGSGEHLCNASKAVTHSTTISSTPATWNFTWVAPAVGVGDVTFYGAIVVGYSNIKVTTTVIPENTTGIFENNLVSFSVYPSPVRDNINFTTFIPRTMKLKASVYSITGEYITTLFNESVPAGELEKSYNLPSSLKNGVYVLNIQGDGFAESRKFIFQ